MFFQRIFVGIVISCWLGFLGMAVDAGDWPMWRYDAGRTAASGDELPAQLTLQWTRTYSPRTQVWDDPLNNDMMPYDRVFEPVVMDGRMFVGFNDQDQVQALDVRDGSVLWTFYTEGPVRLPPVGYRDCVMFTSDDGHLYCVDAATGRLRWRFRGGPSSTHVLGNERLISAWPARGGPVIADDQVYFAASIWPFMGTYIYALDARTGSVIWLNDKTSADYIEQPHSAPSFAGVAPQGALVVCGDYLIVPGGRSVPAVFDRKTGELMHFELNAGGKGNGGSLVMAKGSEFFVHTRERGVRAFELATGAKTEFTTNEPVLGTEWLYAAEIAEEGERKSQPIIRAYDADKKPVWEIAADGRGDLVQAGRRLYAAGETQITAIDLPTASGGRAAIAWTLPVEGTVLRLLAAADRLFAVTEDGTILAFGAESGTPRQWKQSKERPAVASQALARADALLDDAGTRDGYALCYEVEDEELLQAVALRSELHLIVVDPDGGRVERLRQTFDRAGLLGTRVSVHQSTPSAFGAPPYLANVVLIGSPLAASLTKDPSGFDGVFQSVRPYGGSLIPLLTSDQATAFAAAARQADLSRASIEEGSAHILLRRVGALEGSGDWTHQYGDIANTVKSDDRLVMAPLGLLWFGGSSNLDVLPRHGHGPPEQVIGGRLFIEGMNSLSCRDVYTGRVLWKHQFEDLGTFDIYYDATYADTPLDTAYNQVHIPGANGRGTNYVATEDEIYIVVGSDCQVLDAATGELIRVISLPGDAQANDRKWGFIGIYKDILLGGDGFAEYRKKYEISFNETDSKLSGNAAGYGSKSYDVSASAGLIAFDRHTGKVLWRLPAQFSFLHNGIVAGDGKVFCLDKLPQPVEEKLKRRGKVAPDGYRIVAVDAQTGQPVWEVSQGVFGTWLGYSEEYQLLLQAGAQASDRLTTEVGAGMAVYVGDTGEVKWRDDQRAYSGPCILHHDTILTNANAYKLSAGAFSLLDGSQKLVDNPITGEPQPWQVCRAYGCNTIIASEKLLTFRSGAAGFYDLDSMSGTANLGGFKSGCTSNLIVANGVLNAPDYTRTCSCGYQNQTSLALVHMPRLDMWTINHVASLATSGSRVQRVGVNFGAPGDRMAEDGTLWVEYPLVGGQSVDLAVNVAGEEPNYWRQNSLLFRGTGLPWVAASGVENVRRVTIPLEVGLRQGGPGDYVVSHADDDAEEQPDGSVNLTSSDLELVTDKESQLIGVRFEGIDLPKGANIRSAAIQFTCDETSSDETVLQIAAEDSSQAARFSEKTRDISSRPRTTAQVLWKPEPWTQVGAAEAAQQTPDLADLVQSIIDRPDWEAGNPLAFIISGKGKRVAASFRDKVSPRLRIDADRPAESDSEEPPTLHTVRLYFAEPDDQPPGSRVFDVRLQGKLVASRLDVVAEAGQPQTILVKGFSDVPIGDALQIEFEPHAGQPVLCGVEIIRQD